MTRQINADLSPVYTLGLDPDKGKITSTGQYFKINCPFCVERGEPAPDTKQRFHVRVCPDDDFGRYHCFRCGKRGAVGDGSNLNLSLRRVLKQAQERTEAEETAKKDIILPYDFYPIESGMHAWSYLLDRGLTEDDIKYYNVGIGRGRVVFPDYIDGRLCYWTARSYDGRAPKYWSCPGLDGATRDAQIYNLGRFLDEKYESVTLVEGPISAIAAGRDAVATYGKSISESQIERLRSLEIDTVFIAFDPDARMDSIKLARRMLDAYEEVYLIPVPFGHDPATLGRAGFQQLKRECAMRYSFESPDVPIKFMMSA